MPDGARAVSVHQVPQIIYKISEVKIQSATVRIKNGKRPGMDSGMLKCTQDDAIKKLHVLFNKIIAEP